MDKAINELRNKLNTLERQCFNKTSDEDSLTSISDDGMLNANFYKVMKYIKSNYPTAYNKTLIKLNIMPLKKGVENLKELKSYFKHKDTNGQPKPDVELHSKAIMHLKEQNDKLVYLNKSDGSLYELDAIDFFLIRVIINTLRMFLKLPLTKREVYREIAIDMSYDAEPLLSSITEEEGGDISDQLDMDMAQDSCNMCLNQAVGDLQPKIDFLKSISQSTNNWFVITNVSYNPNSDLDYDISVTTDFKTINNIKDIPTDTRDIKEFNQNLKDIDVPFAVPDSDMSDSDDSDHNSDFSDEFDDDYFDDSDYITPAPDVDNPERLYNQIIHLYDIIMEIPYVEND